MFVAVFAAGSRPIPPYDTFSRDGLTSDDFALVAVIYFPCAAIAVLLLGRLSNHHGRLPVGARSSRSLLDAVAALDIRLDQTEIDALEGPYVAPQVLSV